MQTVTFQTDKTVMIGSRISEELFRELDKVRARKGRTKAQILRDAIRLLLEVEAKNNVSNKAVSK